MTTPEPAPMPEARGLPVQQWREFMQSGAEYPPTDGFALEQLIDLQRARSRQMEDAR